MNERIIELALQSGTWEYFNAGDEKTKTMDEQSLRNFAELIVRECAGLVQGVPTDSMGYHTADQKIKEHFGIEE